MVQSRARVRTRHGASGGPDAGPSEFGRPRRRLDSLSHLAASHRTHEPAAGRARSACWRGCGAGRAGSAWVVASLAALTARWSAPQATFLSRPLFRRPSFSRRCSTCSKAFVQARIKTVPQLWGQNPGDKLRRVIRDHSQDVGLEKGPFAGPLVKPSPGLEPGTASLPWRFQGVTRVDARSLAPLILLQIVAVRRMGAAPRDVARVVSDVSVLCPRCVADVDNDQVTSRLSAGRERRYRLLTYADGNSLPG
jgi:hypothetical protein